MRRDLAPLGGRFNSNRNRGIVELSCLYCHLFDLFHFAGEGKLYFYVSSFNKPSFRNSYLLIFCTSNDINTG